MQGDHQDDGGSSQGPAANSSAAAKVTGDRSAPTPVNQPWGNVLRRVAWEDVFPWLLLFRAFRLSLSPTIIVLGSIGVLLSPLGWIVAKQLFVSEQMRELDPVLASSTEYYSSFARPMELVGQERATMDQWLPWHATGAFRAIASEYGGPLAETLSLHPTPQAENEENQPFAFGLRRFAYFSLGAIWTIAVWALVGGVITRVNTVRLTRDERVNVVDATRFVLKRYLTYLSSPLMPLTIVLLFVLIMLIPGWIMWLGNIGAFLMALIWGLFLILGLAVGLLLVVLSVAWPLMAPAISTESGDAFDAISRSFAYVYQRPLQYLFYSVIAVLLLTVGGFIGGVVGGTVSHVTLWSASWGAGSSRINELTQPAVVNPIVEEASEDSDSTQEPMTLRGSRGILRFWNGLVVAIRNGFLQGLFWTLATAAYLLLRRSVDETEMDEVHLEDEEDPEELPKLEKPPGTDSPSPESAKQEPSANETTTNKEVAEEEASLQEADADEPDTPQLVDDATSDDDDADKKDDQAG